MPYSIKPKTVEIVYENKAGDFVCRRVLNREQAVAILERDNLVVEQILHDSKGECWFACPVGEPVALN